MAIQEKMVVSFTYELKDNATKEVIDASGDAPLEFITGFGHIIPGLEKQIILMNIGDSAVVVVSPEEAYGTFDEAAVRSHPKEQFAGLDLVIGMPLYGQSEDGNTVQVTVRNFNDEEVMIDYNHPLAGKELAFDVTLQAVRMATAEEVLTGRLNAHCETPGQGGGGCGSGCGCH